MASGWRRKSREAALQLVYQVELGGDRSEASLERFWIRLPGATDDARDYGKFLADVVFERMEQIDAAIERATENWQIDRISRVDLCLLRVAAGELVFVPETPARVVI
ncbi:MAG: transcription antitermination protein NusB, partial [Candidatus Binatia bacterium]